MNFNLESARDTPCKNILIYGYCKYENKGCVFSHSRGLGQQQRSSTTTTSSAALAPGTGSGNSPGLVHLQQTPAQTNQTSSGGISGVSNSNPTTMVESKRKFNFNTPSFQPSGNTSSTSVSGLTNKFASLLPKVGDIPTFVPYGEDGPGSGTGTGSDLGIKKFNASTPSFTPAGLYSAEESESSQKQQLQLHQLQQLQQLQHQNQQLQQIQQGRDFASHTPTPMQQHQYQMPMAGTPPTHSGPLGKGIIPNSGVNPYLQNAQGGASLVASSGAPDMYFSQGPSHPNAGLYPLAYHLYAPAPPPRLTIPLSEHETNANKLFIPNELREALHRKNEATLQTLSHSNLPNHVDVYHSLVPIDKTYSLQSSTWGIPASTYKVFSSVDGNPYVLRKLEHDFAITNETPFKTINKWKLLRNSNVIKLYDAFTTMVFGNDASLVLVYDYYPEAKTLIEMHSKKGTFSNEPVTEDILWLYIVQIANALQGIHDKLLAARRSLDLSKIIVTSKNRIRLSGCGVDDVLNYEDDARAIAALSLSSHAAGLRIEDMKAFGLVIVQLAALLLLPSQRQGDPQHVFDIIRVSCGFSDALIEVIAVLLDPTANGITTINQVIERYLAVKMMNYVNDVQDQRDFLESQLTSELENARLFRLICKLNFIIDRPEFEGENPITSTPRANGNANRPLNHNTSRIPGSSGNNGSGGEGNQEYSRNGNKYILKLFRDYVFMQYDDVGKPVVDLSRVLTIMNKLDAGIDERFVLVSRDQKSCIIVSFKEIRDLLDSVFRQITRG